MLTAKHAWLKLISLTWTASEQIASPLSSLIIFAWRQIVPHQLQTSLSSDFSHPCTKTCFSRGQIYYLYSYFKFVFNRSLIDIFTLTEPEMLFLPESFRLQTFNKQNVPWLVMEGFLGINIFKSVINVSHSLLTANYSLHYLIWVHAESKITKWKWKKKTN